MNHYSGYGNAAADGCGLLVFVMLGLLIGGLVLWFVMSM